MVNNCFIRNVDRLHGYNVHEMNSRPQFERGIQYMSNKNKGKAISLKKASNNIPINNRNTNNNNNNKMKGQALNQNKSTKSRTAKQKTTSEGGFRVKHSELVQVINDTVGFQVFKLDLNPGLVSVFPWLSAVAQRYETYKFHNLSFEFVSRCSATKIGSIILSPDYDPDDYGTPSESQMSFYKNAIEDSQWKDFSMKLSNKDMFTTGSRKNVRSELIAGTLKNYDCGKLWIGTNGDGVTSIGKLWVHYDVELFTPASDLIENENWLTPDIYSRNADAEQTLVVGIQQPVIFGTLRGSGKLPVTYNAANGEFTVPRGAYRVAFELPSRITTANEDDGWDFSIQQIVGGAPTKLFSLAQHVQGTGDLVQTPLQMTKIMHFHKTTTFSVYVLPTVAAGTVRIEYNLAEKLIATIDIELL